MKPIAEIPQHTCAALRGVVFDIDDTVTCHGRLETVALDAMWKLSDAGVARVAVTGRPLGWIDVVAWQWPVDLAVGENGAGWAARRGTELMTGYADDVHARAEQRAILDRIVERVRRELPHVPLTQDAIARRCDVAFDVGEHARVCDADRASLVAIIEGAGARALVSSVHMHAVASEHDKASGVVGAAREALRADLAAEREQWLFVGDSGNDAAAFAHFPVSAGVANVGAHIHALSVPPAYVATRTCGTGFAEIVAAVLARRVV